MSLPYFVALEFEVQSPHDFVKDLLIDTLATIHFDTFEEIETGFCAYIHADKYDEQSTEDVLAELKSNYAFSYVLRHIPYENWNQIWESNFQPVIIAGKCLIRASFHPPQPDIEIEVIINPKMAFGTGHHETTSLMTEYLLEIPLQHKAVLDMGCGTGILSIIASKLGASTVTAIDNDAQAIANAQECITTNNCTNIVAFAGDKEDLAAQKPVDVLLANINRNILIGQMNAYAKCTKPQGLLLMSGFYKDHDLKLLIEKAEEVDFTYQNHKEKNNWAAAAFKKN